MIYRSNTSRNVLQRIGIFVLALALSATFVPLSAADHPGTCTVSGTVRDAATATGEYAGDPLSNIQIIAVPADVTSAGGLLTTIVPATTQTDLNGEYELHLQDGNYRLVARDQRQPPEYRPAERAVNGLECPTGAPAVTGVDFSLSPLLALPGGPTTPGTGEILVTVYEYVDATTQPHYNRPRGGLSMAISLPECAGFPTASQPGQVQSSTTTDANGQVRFTGLAPGSYCVRVSQAGWADSQQTLVVNADATTTSTIFTRQDEFRPSLSGTIYDFDAATTTKVGGAVVRIDDGFYCEYGEKPVIQVGDTTLIVGATAGYECQATAGPNAEYSFTQPRHGELRFRTDHPLFNEKTELFTIATVGSPNNPLIQDIELSRSASALTAVVRDGGAVVAGATVTLIGFETELTHVVTTDSSGRFVAPVLTDTYRVEIESGAKSTSLCVGLYSHGRTLPDVDINAPATLVSGVAIDTTRTDDAPLRDANISIVTGSVTSPVGVREDACQVRSGGNGEFAMSVPQGTHTIRGSKVDFETTQSTLNAATPALDAGEIHIARSLATITGRAEEARWERVTQQAVRDALGLGPRYVPLAGEAIECTGASLPTISALADASGTYSLNAPIGSGYVCGPASEEFLTPTGTFDLSADGTTRNLNLQRALWPVIGTVRDALDPDAELENAQVCVRSPHLLETLTEVPCARSTADGSYRVLVPFSAIRTSSPVPAQTVSVNAVLITASKTGYMTTGSAAIIGHDANLADVVDFNLVPLGGGVPPVPGVPSGPMDVVPDALNCAEHEEVGPWLNQLTSDPTCGEGGTPNPMDLVPPELNCHGHDDVVAWVNQLASEPTCE